MCANPKYICVSIVCLCKLGVYSENTELSCNRSVTKLHYILCGMTIRNPNVHYSRPVKNTEVMAGCLNPGSFIEYSGQFNLTPKPNLVLQSGGGGSSLVTLQQLMSVINLLKPTGHVMHQPV